MNGNSTRDGLKDEVVQERVDDEPIAPEEPVLETVEERDRLWQEVSTFALFLT